MKKSRQKALSPIAIIRQAALVLAMAIALPFAVHLIPVEGSVPVGARLLPVFLAPLIALYFFQDFPLWLMLLIVLRDVFILFGALFIYEKHQQITASNWPGKVAVFFIALAILVFLAGFKTVFEYAVILAMLSLLFSALMYGKVFFKSFYEQRKS